MSLMENRFLGGGTNIARPNTRSETNVACLQKNEKVRFMKNIINVTVAVGLLLAYGSAQAGLIGQSTSISSNGLRYEGLGSAEALIGNFPEFASIDPALRPNIGVGGLEIGDCITEATTRTCTTSGTFVETAGSTNPGATGSFTFVQTYTPQSFSLPGFIVRSESPGDDSLIGVRLLFDTTFQLTLSGSTNLELTLPGDAFGFSAFGDPGSLDCRTGDAPASCTIGSVGLTNGAILTGNIADDGFFFSIPHEPRSGCRHRPLSHYWASVSSA
jgi:hypothetical protein